VSVGKPLVQIGLLGEAIEGAPFAVLVADENGRYVAVNSEACNLFGYPREEFVGLSVTDVVTGEDVAAHYQRFVRARSEEGTVEARRKDGTTFRFAFRAGETTIVGLRYYVSVGWPAE
jgi:PAS domain S-box-containing protein